jgi:hypothetical protein
VFELIMSVQSGSTQEVFPGIHTYMANKNDVNDDTTQSGSELSTKQIMYHYDTRVYRAEIQG